MFFVKFEIDSFGPLTILSYDHMSIIVLDGEEQLLKHFAVIIRDYLVLEDLFIQINFQLADIDAFEVNVQMIFDQVEVKSQPPLAVLGQHSNRSCGQRLPGDRIVAFSMPLFALSVDFKSNLIAFYHGNTDVLKVTFLVAD